MSTMPILLITGANTGLGFEVVKALCRSPKRYVVLLGGRSLPKAEDATQRAKSEYPDSPSEVVAVQIDIEDDSSISKLFDDVSSKYGRLDVLINNAGAQFDPEYKTGRMTMREMWDKSWSVNTTSTQVITNTFVPLLLKSSDPRLLFVTSGTSTLTETEGANVHAFLNKAPPKGWPKETFTVAAYRSSKTGMNMMMREWERILREDGVKVWCISPGMLATGLGGDMEANKQRGALDPAVGGNFIKDVVEGKRDLDVGKVIRKDNIQPW